MTLFPSRVPAARESVPPSRREVRYGNRLLKRGTNRLILCVKLSRSPSFPSPASSVAAFTSSEAFRNSSKRSRAR
jgi:hypothetical protein